MQSLPTVMQCIKHMAAPVSFALLDSGCEAHFDLQACFNCTIAIAQRTGLRSCMAALAVNCAVLNALLLIADHLFEITCLSTTGQ